MLILTGLAALIGLVFLLVAVLGLIAPALFRNRKTGETPPRTHLLSGGLLAALIAFGVAGGLYPKAGDGATSPAPVLDPAETVQSDKGLGMTPEGFRKLFNALASQDSPDYEIPRLTLDTKGNVSSFTHLFSERTGIFGTVTPQNGSLEYVMLVTSGLKTDPSQKVDSLSVLLYTAQTLNPTVDRDENNQAVVELIKEAVDKSGSTAFSDRQVGKLKYSANVSRVTGLMFSISRP